MKYQKKILVACEFSGVVRDAFIKAGYNAYSCDLIDTESYGPHLIGDVRNIMNDGTWDLMIAHPPCTYLCSSGLHWNKRRPERQKETDKAIEFIRDLMNAKIPRIALENPIGCISTRIRHPEQIIHPWQFGHNESKTTCLWLKNLPKLVPTQIIGDKKTRRDNQTPSGQNKLGPSPDRGKIRSITYAGIARAMAEQWGPLLGG